MDTLKARSATLSLIWIIGLATLALPAVQACLPGVAGLALVTLPFATTAAVLAALTPGWTRQGALRRIGPALAEAV